MKNWTNPDDLVDHNGGMDRVALIDARTEPVNIRQAVVVPRADEECSQIPVAFVVKAEAASLTVQDVKDYTLKNGPSYQYPRRVLFAAELPLESLTELLANHLGPRGITVNAIAPGATVTDMNRLDEDPEKAKATANTIALRRVGYPQDVATVALFLCSSAGGWVTGQCVDASGGQRL
ncbi:SDR family oxidoreductase [Hoeflea sp. CAU 1731]